MQKKVKKERKSKALAKSLTGIAVDGVITPQMVVAEAEKEDSPLHDYFEWDDSEAARKYRLWQARFLIKTLEVEIEGKTMPRFQHVVMTVEDKQIEGYMPTSVVFKNRSLREQAIADALKRLTYWQEQYDNFKPLKGLIDSTKLAKLKKKYN